MSAPAFADLGKHCGVEECELIDFLPFNCNRCDQVFCLQHRSSAEHLCPVASQIDMTLLICPLCAQGVRLLPNEDPNITWDIHVNCECDPSNYQNAAKKKLCSSAGCKEALFFSNTIRCKDCNQEHCLRHKFARDHGCAGPKKPDAGFPFLDALRRSRRNNAARIQSSTKLGLNLLNAASSIRASAEAGMQRLSIATNQALQKARDGIHKRGGEHAFDAAAIEVCPVCGETFGDPVLLVEHVEEDHGDSAGI